jgi:protease I
MQKSKLLIFVIIAIIVIGFLIYRNLTKEEVKEKIAMPEKNLVNKKIVMIVAFKDFRDEEYFVPKEILEKAGVEVKTASSKMGTAIGADGGEAKVDLLIQDINVSDFDAIVFIGGPGALKYLDNENSYRVAREAITENKVLAAICISPAILAKAGVLEGKRATVWSSPLDKSPIKTLEEGGAIYQDETVVIDGKIITGNGPAAAKEFGQKLLTEI